MEKSRFIVCRNIVFVLIFLPLLVLGCSSHPCREPRQPDLDVTKKTAPGAPPSPAEIAVSGPGTPKLSPPGPAVGSVGSNGTSASATPPPAATGASNLPARVRVYKPDGSRQCEKGGGKSVEAMERELAGITVRAREKRKDGLMHIQVCGSPTGVVNIYEIDSTFLKQAEERGFKRFED